MILCVGEILADMIGKTQDGHVSYDRRAGGAPFNVACGIKQFGAKSAFAGCVGDDIIGHFLYDFAQTHVDEVAIRLDPRHNTTLAFVELDERGERSFCFYRRDTADTYLPSVGALLDRANIVHIGSLMLSEERGVSYAENLLWDARGAGKLVSFDVNYREDVFPDKQDAAARFRVILERSDIIKLSEEELAMLGHGYVERGLRNQLVCITLGARGCMWRYKRMQNTLPTIPVETVDTTGAGDAFYAGVLSQLDGLPKQEWTKENLDRVFTFANACGALTTRSRGAIDALPTLEEVQSALRGQ